MEEEKLERRERDFENGKGRHGGERKKKICFWRCRGVTNVINNNQLFENFKCFYFLI